MSLNPFKCVTAVRRGVLLGYVISEEGMPIDAKKIKVMQTTKKPANLKEASRFVG